MVFSSYYAFIVYRPTGLTGFSFETHNRKHINQLETLEMCVFG